MSPDGILLLTATLAEAKGVLSFDPLSKRSRFRLEGSVLIAQLGPVGGSSCLCGVTGMGPKAAYKGVRQILRSHGPFREVVGLGLAGGLSPKVNGGDLLIPNVIRFQDQELRPTPRLVQEFSQLARTSFWTSGITVSEVVNTPRRKEDLFDQWRAEFVDMESGAWGAACQEAGVDWGIVRSVLDGPRDVLPNVLEALSDRFGRPKGIASIVTLLKHVNDWPSLFRVLARQMPQSFRAIRGVLSPWVTTKPNNP